MLPFTPATTRLKLSKVPTRICRTAPPFGRVRIDVVEPFEVGRVFDIAEQRQRMPPRRLGCLRPGPAQNRARQGQARARGPSRRLRRPAEDVVGSLPSAEFLLLTPVRAVDVRRPDADTQHEAELVRPQYKARIRQITLLFPHDNSPDATAVRRNVPITTTAMPHNKRPGNAWPSYHAQIHAGLAKSYFAAVGSGSGLSDNLFR